MAFALLIIGITLVVAAVRDTQGTLISLIQGDFTGPGNFWYWIAAILALGALGYIPRLKPVSDGLIVVVIIALLLSRGDPKNGGFFKKLTDALNMSTKTSAAPSTSVGSVVTNILG